MKIFNIATIFLLSSFGFLEIAGLQTSSSGQNFYVSRNGNNADGLSWETAWNELNQIRWDAVQAGSVIYIDGGSSEMSYETELSIGSSGIEGAAIQIQASKDIGHEGQVIFFGGRSLDLPYCGQESYEDVPSEQIRGYGIQSNGHDFVTIDGGRWRGIKIHGYLEAGIQLDPDSQNVTVQYVEVYNNGEAKEDSWEGGWEPDHAGVRLAGENITFRRVIIHDNGQDAFQSMSGDNHIRNFRLEQSWLFNARRHPSVNESANFCTHTDGLQIFDGGMVSDISFTESIIGPGFTQNVILGQTRNENGSWADVQNVTFQDVVFTKAADNNVVGYRDTNPGNWLLDHVTIDCLETKSHCLRIPNSNHTIRDSIVINGLITFPDGLATYSGNCQWQTEGFDIGEEVDPLFVNVSLTDVFALDNYAVSSDSPCQGSRMSSVEQLLSLN
jgi:hypothetical protein